MAAENQQTPGQGARDKAPVDVIISSAGLTRLMDNVSPGR